MWVTDMVLADKLRKIILSTGDNSIQFYELSNFEPYCQLSYLENLPLKLDFWCDPEDANNCILSFADDKCYLNILILPNISDDFKMWKKGIKKNNIPTCPLSNAVPSGGPSSTGLQFYRWKVHNNWITQLRYYGEVSSLFSSSNDPESSLIIGTPTGSTYVDASLSGTFETSLTLSPVRPNVAMSRQQSQQSSANSFSRQLSSVRKAAMFARPNSSFPPRKKTQAEHRVFRIAKGVSSFDYSNGYNVLVTGGMDRVVRAWNPYMTSKPVCCMYGHLSPVQSVFIAEGEERIYSVSFDNCVKVWNLLEYQCLITVIAGMHKVNMTIDVMMYNPLSKILLFGGDQLHALRQTSRVPVGEKVRSHDYPVVSVGYSSVFKQVVSVCEGSVMRVWSLETGKKVTEKENLHGNSPVTAMVLDPGERRAVTATQNGEIKIWNQNTGQCLKTLKKGNTKEVTEMCYFSVSSTAKYLVCVGWDKQLNVFQDSLDTVHQVAVPKSMWTTASRGIHKEDLTAVASGGTNFLATASFDGEIVIWSFLSGAVFSRIRPLRVPENTAHEPAEGDESVSKVMFLKSRAKSRDSADFVVGHYSGFVSFWNVYSSRKTFGCFNSTRGQPISTMAADSEETLLYVADSLGYITLFNIANYCINGPSDSSPSVINKWRAHSKKISCLEYVPEEHLLVSSSHDGCIRLWKQHGEFIGTFGQSRLWSLQYSSSLKSPHMPEDVVLDTEGLPETHETSAEHKEEPISTIQATSFVMPSSQEESSEDMKNKKEGKDSLQLPREGQRVGKRLHNFRTRDTPQDRGGYPSYYHSLPCYSLGDDPTGKFAH
jgi:WD40 repeat protein